MHMVFHRLNIIVQPLSHFVAILLLASHSRVGLCQPATRDNDILLRQGLCLEVALQDVFGHPLNPQLQQSKGQACDLEAMNSIISWAGKLNVPQFNKERPSRAQ